MGASSVARQGNLFNKIRKRSRLYHHCLVSLRLAGLSGFGEIHGCGKIFPYAETIGQQWMIFPEWELVLRRRWPLKPRHASHLNAGVLMYVHDEKLLKFATNYGDAIQLFRDQVHSLSLTTVSTEQCSSGGEVSGSSDMVFRTPRYVAEWVSSWR